MRSSEGVKMNEKRDCVQKGMGYEKVFMKDR